MIDPTSNAGRFALRTLSLAIPPTVFALVLTMPVPSTVLKASCEATVPIVLGFGPLLLICHWRTGWRWTIAGLSITLALFALPLHALWQQIGFHFNAVGGLLPFSDASGYYYEASRLADGHLLNWSSRRPLFTGMLATLLALTGQNLQLTVAILVAITGASCYMLAREVRAWHGTIASVLVTILLFLFYRFYGGEGTTLSENLGLPLGIIAFAVIWKGLGEQRSGLTCTGLGLLTLALMARAGAFFVLPAMILAGGTAFRKAGRSSSRFFVGAGVAVAISVAVALGLGRALADPAASQAAFSNFSQTLYGLVVGGKGWQQVSVDHPGAREGAEIYRLAFEAFKAHPTGLVVGAVRMWLEYLPPHSYHAFAFVRDPSYDVLVQLTCYILTAIALVVAIGNVRQPPYAVLLAAFAGHVASIPFVPPIDAGLRVYAATIPIFAILPAIGAAAIVQGGGRLLANAATPTGSTRSTNASRPIVQGYGSSPAPLIFGLTLSAFVVAGPILIYAYSKAPAVTHSACGDGGEEVDVRVTPGSFLRIRADDWHEGAPVMAPDVRVRDLRRTAGAVEIRDDVDKFTAFRIMANTWDVETGRYVWLIAPLDLVPDRLGLVRICGHDSEDALSKRYGVFYADSVQPIEPVE